MNQTVNPTSPQVPPSWWRNPYVWMLIAGPLAVVVAGFVTLWIAVRSPDPVLEEDYYRKGVEINRTLDQEGQKAMMPAVQGRNHAVTPQQDLPARKP